LEDGAHLGDTFRFTGPAGPVSVAGEVQAVRTGLAHRREDPAGGLRPIERDNQDSRATHG
jgi:hypothetical protein